MYKTVILSKLCARPWTGYPEEACNFEVKAYFGTNHVGLFFFKTLYCIFYSSYDIFIRNWFKSN